MKSIFSLLLISFSLSGYAYSDDFNLDFEKVTNNKPVGWQSYGVDDNQISVDQTTVQQGEYSLKMTNPSSASKIQNWSVKLPAKYQGEKISLSGYIKADNVRNGVAGFAMSISPSIAYDAMQGREISGTTDWKKYQIDLDLQSKRAKEVIFSVFLTGTGTIWVDNLQLLIDGKPIETAPLRELSLAEQDKEFDNGSNISLKGLTEQQLDNLTLLGKVWGFLKYHHPEIAKGNYNWDYELLRFLPKYQQATSILARDQLLLNWINGLGAVPLCNHCKPTANDAYVKPDFNWINAHQLSSELQQKLQFVYKNRHQGTHYYIGSAEGVGNPIFSNEASYANMPFPDDGFRLLALYRYWNIIHYYNPNKHLTDKDWRAVLKQYIPVFVAASSELEYEQAMLKLIYDVQDSHAQIDGGHNAYQELLGHNRAAVITDFIESQLVVTGYYHLDFKEASGLKVGDVITSIEGVKVSDLVELHRPLTPASNDPTQLRFISLDLLRSNKSSVRISYRSVSSEGEKVLPLYGRKQLKAGEYFRERRKALSLKSIDDDIGYVMLASTVKSDIKKIAEEFKDKKGIIVDIRGYPNTFITHQLVEIFTRKATSWVRFSAMNPNNPGEFTLGEALKTAGNKDSYQGKLVVLVNEKSLSQAEFTAMALRAGDNTTIIGSTTAGADGNVSTIYLPGNIRTRLSGIGVYYPDGAETQRVGIVPDIEVQPTIEGVRAGRDELLEKAIEIIRL